MKKLMHRYKLNKKQAIEWLVNNLSNQYDSVNNFWLVTDITKTGDKVATLYHHLCYLNNNSDIVGKDSNFIVSIPKKTYRRIKRLANK